MRQVFVAQHPTEAYFVKGLLESEGIAAEIKGEPLFGVRGEIPVTEDTLPSVWVLDDAQVTKAGELLRDFNASSDAPASETWRCPNCNETLEGQFSICWKCGAEKPSAN